MIEVIKLAIQLAVLSTGVFSMLFNFQNTVRTVGALLLSGVTFFGSTPVRANFFVTSTTNPRVFLPPPDQRNDSMSYVTGFCRAFGKCAVARKTGTLNKKQIKRIQKRTGLKNTSNPSDRSIFQKPKTK